MPSSGRHKTRHLDSASLDAVQLVGKPIITNKRTETSSILGFKETQNKAFSVLLRRVSANLVKRSH
jgi:hypothetical protein